MRPWEANIRKVVPYVPGDQPGGDKLIKLNTNENPYPPAPGAIRALRELETDRLRKYPDPAASMLVEALAGYYGVGSDQVFVGVGSDDVIAMSFLTFFNSDKPVLFPDITYSFYKVWADLYRIPYDTPALDGDFNIIPEDYEKENGGVIFPNPNAPTGIYMPLEQVEGILKANQDVVVIVDEAYHYFYDKTFLPKISEYDNVVLIRTFSKLFSLASCRLGFIAGNETLIRYIWNVRPTFDTNAVALKFGEHFLSEPGLCEHLVAVEREGREYLKASLREHGYEYFAENGNYAFIRVKTSVSQVKERLEEKKILIKTYGQEMLKDYIRISTGSRRVMEQFTEALYEVDR